MSVHVKYNLMWLIIPCVDTHKILTFDCSDPIELIL